MDAVLVGVTFGTDAVASAGAAVGLGVIPVVACVTAVVDASAAVVIAVVVIAVVVIAVVTSDVNCGVSFFRVTVQDPTVIETNKQIPVIHIFFTGHLLHNVTVVLCKNNYTISAFRYDTFRIIRIRNRLCWFPLRSTSRKHGLAVYVYILLQAVVIVNSLFGKYLIKQKRGESFDSALPFYRHLNLNFTCLRSPERLLQQLPQGLSSEA